MKRMILMAMLAGTAALTVMPVHSRPASAWLCTYKSHVDSGINRICIYKCPLGESALTIRISQICPISIDG